MSLSFTLADRPPPRWLLFSVQAVLVPVVSEMLAFCLIFLGSIIGKSSLPSEDDLIEAFVGSIGFLLGLIVVRIAPSLKRSGSWIWIPTLALFAVGLISDLSTLPPYYQGSYSRVFAMWAYDAGSDEGGRILLGTCPVYATVAYSLAIFLMSRKHTDV